MTLGIYEIKNNINGKIYIGSCSDTNNQIEGRIENGHFYRLRKGTHPNPKLQYAWNKYGEENFSWSILQELTNTDNILDIETEWINRLKSYDNSIGYNIAKDALAPMKGRTMSSEARSKISEAVKGRSVSEKTKEKLRNRVVSDETREKIRKANLGKKISEDTKIKLSIGQFKRYCKDRGVEYTYELYEEHLKKKEIKKNKQNKEEWKEKLRQANLGKKASKETREKMSRSQRNYFDNNPKPPISDETRQKLCLAQKKRFENKEEREKIWANRKK